MFHAMGRKASVASEEMGRIGSVSPRLAEHLTLPLIAAPMLRISGPELVIAACRAGVIGAFPTANARSLDQLDAWLGRITAETGRAAAFAANLIIRQPRMAEDLELLVRHRVPMVITSVGSPAPAIAPLRAVGTAVFADVGTIHHARRAAEAGADGLILLTAGAGGQTGWLNPFAFVSAVREFFSGPVVLAGGVGDGRSLWAARTAGYDLAYAGTGFIAATESLAAERYRQMLVDSSADDVVLTRAFTGLRSSILAPSVRAAGLDPDRLDEQISVADSARLYGDKAPEPGPRRWQDIWSAGHSVSGVREIAPAAQIVARFSAQYRQARAETARLLGIADSAGPAGGSAAPDAGAAR